jgi:hypothetical protein
MLMKPVEKKAFIATSYSISPPDPEPTRSSSAGR